MMTHPDQLFAAAKEKMEQYRQETRLANEQTCQMRHWLAERVRRLADRLDVEYVETGLVVGKF
jgi:hypothetical protein